MLIYHCRSPYSWIVGIVVLLIVATACDSNKPDPTLEAHTLTPTQTEPAATVRVIVQRDATVAIEPIATAIPLVQEDATVQVASINRIELSVEVTITEEDRDSFRPIATVASAELTLAPPTRTPLPQPTATSEPEHVRDARISLENRSFAGDATRTNLHAQLANTQAYLRNLSFLISQADANGTLNCPEFVKGYAQLTADMPTFDVSEELALAFFYYNRAVEDAVKHFSHLNLRCNDLVEAHGELAAQIPVAQIQPRAAYDEALEHHFDILTNGNRAVLWINADDRVTVELYQRIKQLIRQLRTTLNNGPTTAECVSIVEQYGEIGRSPQFSPAVDTYRYRAYQWYLESVATAQETGQEIVQHCQTHLEGSEATSTATPEPQSGAQLPAELVQPAVSGLNIGLSFINNAIALIPAPTPQPTAIPVHAEVIAIQEGQRNYLWEIVVEVINISGTPPYRALIGGFEMQPDRTITIVHTCELDFIDHIILVDATGQLFISQKITANRPPHCFD